VIEIFAKCIHLLQTGENVVLMTVFEARGSAPRTAGARMLVRTDGSSLGTIGGGRLEHEAIAAALTLFQTKASIIQCFDLTGNDVAGMDMICGGRGEIWIEFLDAGDPEGLSVCREITRLLQQGEKAWLLTLIDGPATEGNFRKCLVRKDLSCSGSLPPPGDLLAQLEKGTGGPSVYAAAVAGARYLIEAIVPAQTVYVFGAGHVSQAVVPLCESVGFRTVALDDRAEFACSQRFSPATRIVLLNGFDCWPELGIDEDSFIVILTRGHLHDKVALAQALRTSAGYIGMIGSRRKRDKIYQTLLAEGFSQTEIDRVHSPIGLNIGAETPAELAVSIVAELIQVRAAKLGRK